MRQLAEAAFAQLAAAEQAEQGGATQRAASPAPPAATAPSAEPQAAASPLPPRFTDAELMRFAMMHGLLRATTPAQRQAALQEGAAAAARTARWLGEHPFSTEAELQRFAHLVSWQVSAGPSSSCLGVRLGLQRESCRYCTAADLVGGLSDGNLQMHTACTCTMHALPAGRPAARCLAASGSAATSRAARTARKLCQPAGPR